MRTSAPRILLFPLALLVAGLAFSCSSSSSEQSLKSCADTCTGCCMEAADGGETCVPLAQEEFATCGRGGAACRACVPGQMCSAGQCLQDTGPVDAGSDAGTDAGTDAGSDAGTDGGGSVDNGCGHASEACCHGSACYLPLVCGGDGMCGSGTSGGTDAGTDAGTTVKGVGGACSGDAECQTGHCETSFAGGYCTQTCATNTDCPSGSKCGYNQEGTSLVCLAVCSGAGAQGSCRDGYVCDTASAQDGTAVCVPSCTATSCAGGAAGCSASGFCCGGTNANTGAYEACCGGATCNGGLACGTNNYCAPSSGPQPTGSACTDGTQCAGDTCIGQESGSACGGSNGTCWAGGYCTETCNSDGSGCAGGSSCASFGSAGYLCLDDCNWDGASGGCRSGYVCDRFVTIGQNSGTTASCINACSTGADCPTGACNNGFCCGGELYRCCGGNTCASGLVCQTSGPYAGYCTSP